MHQGKPGDAAHARRVWSTMGGVSSPAVASAGVREPGRTPAAEITAEARMMLDLPTDRPRRSQRSGHRGRVSLDVDLELGGDLAHAPGGTIVAAAFASLLNRYTNEEELALGYVEGGKPGLVLWLGFT